MSYENSIIDLAKSLQIKGKKILITGATGLIGACIIDVLIKGNEKYKLNNEIYALCRNRENLYKKFGENVFSIIQDINEPLNCNIEFDFIVHAASNADPKNYAIYPAKTILTNIIGTKNILDYCKNHLNTRLIYTSTFEVYGKLDGVDIYDESMTGIVDLSILRNGYPESKRCAELLVRSYVDEYNIQGMIARLSSVYGPTMLKSDSKAHAEFIKNAVKKENIVLKSKGLQRRTYCYVIDAVSAIFMLLENGINGQTYNVANENSIASIAEVAETCAKLASTKVEFQIPSDIENKGYSKPQNCILENSKLRSLGWEGKFSLIDGIRETIEYLCEDYYSDNK